YNRVINRAVIDELSNRFLVNGQAALRDLEQQVGAIEKELQKSRTEITNVSQTIDHGGLTIQKVLDARNRTATAKKIQNRYNASLKVGKNIILFLRKGADHHQPAQKLHEATIHAITGNRSKFLDDAFALLEIHETIPLVERDRRVILGRRILQIRSESIMLEGKFDIAQATKNDAAYTKVPEGGTNQPFFKSCSTCIAESTAANIPKLAVEVSLYFATASQIYQSSRLLQESDRAKATAHVAEANAFLGNALGSCKHPFQNADKLGRAAEESCVDRSMRT
ncbi:hypothetical protein DM02DRAFT_665334, partial [Periconia macrospinosa]